MKHKTLVVLFASVASLLLTSAVAPASPTGDVADRAPRHARISLVDIERSSVKPQTREQSLSEAELAGQGRNVLDKIAATPLGAGCWVWSVSITYRNAFNQKLISYFNETHWCGDGNWIYGAWFRTFSQTHYPGWDYDADRSNGDNYSSYGDGWNVYLTGGTGHFCYVRYFSCITETHPWMEVYVGAGGQRYYHHWRG